MGLCGLVYNKSARLHVHSRYTIWKFMFSVIKAFRYSGINTRSITLRCIFRHATSFVLLHMCILIPAAISFQVKWCTHTHTPHPPHLKENVIHQTRHPVVQFYCSRAHCRGFRQWTGGHHGHSVATQPHAQQTVLHCVFGHPSIMDSIKLFSLFVCVIGPYGLDLAFWRCTQSFSHHRLSQRSDLFVWPFSCFQNMKFKDWW